MDARKVARGEFTRWALGLMTLTLSGLALAGCGKDLAPADPQAPAYTRESPPPFVRSAEASSSDFLAANWYTVASGSVTKGKSKTIAGSHYSLYFASSSLTVSSLSATIKEQNPGVIDFQLAPAGAQFSTPVKLTISYAGTNADPSSPTYTPGALTFFVLNPNTGIWEVLPGTDNTSLKQYVISLSSFSSITSAGNVVTSIEVALAKVPPPGTGDW